MFSFSYSSGSVAWELNIVLHDLYIVTDTLHEQVTRWKLGMKKYALINFFVTLGLVEMLNGGSHGQPWCVALAISSNAFWPKCWVFRKLLICLTLGFTFCQLSLLTYNKTVILSFVTFLSNDVYFMRMYCRFVGKHFAKDCKFFTIVDLP